MACSSCQQNQLLARHQIDPSQLQNMPIENVLALYRQGYRIPDNVNMQSMAFSDISSWQYFKLGIWSWLSYKSHKTKHEIWAIIFGAIALGTAGDVYSTYKK